MTLNINKLREEIEKSNFGKSEIATKCGIDRKTIENVLSGRDPKVSTITSLASVLGIKISYLFDEANIEVRDNERSFNSNADETMKELTSIIKSQEERIRQLTDKLLEERK